MNKILVIEDEDLIREGIVLILTVNGYEVFEAENGRIGTAVALKEIPDLIISDIMMPEMNGFAVLKTVRANPETSTVPFLFLSAKADQTDIRQGMNLGADDYLTKPFQLDELLKAVRVRLDRSTAEKAKTQEKIDTLRANLSFALPHELLTPLNGILGLSKMLKESWAEFSQEDATEMLDEIHLSGRRLYRLVQNFLLFSRLELLARDPAALKQFTNSSTHSAADIIETMANSVASSYGRSADMKIMLNDAAVKIAPEHLSKIIEELTDNAFKFSESGTHISIISRTDGQNFIIEISGGGRGMSPEEIRQIGGYMQFGRQEHEQQGSGLGLAISKKIVDFCRGTLAIEPLPGGGIACIARLAIDHSLAE
ncbi:response regulator [Ignavibacteria bacterium]|nr:hybrid sensor histidine kinase/response regulator [Bacteroidota bacterium]MCZ2133563.1 hybrid sensor histidine kinase/response regulator [Bacteroidota bacterium]